jgi:hypothetical protein
LKGEIILGFRVNVQILENETITEENYKKWPDEAILDLGSVVDQVCGVQEEYIEQFGVEYFTPISYLDYYRKKPKVTKDNANDPFIRDYVIPDLLKVRIVNIFSERCVI